MVEPSENDSNAPNRTDVHESQLIDRGVIAALPHVSLTDDDFERVREVAPTVPRDAIDMRVAPVEILDSTAFAFPVGADKFRAILTGPIVKVQRALRAVGLRFIGINDIDKDRAMPGRAGKPIAIVYVDSNRNILVAVGQFDTEGRSPDPTIAIHAGGNRIAFAPEAHLSKGGRFERAYVVQAGDVRGVPAWTNATEHNVARAEAGSDAGGGADVSYDDLGESLAAESAIEIADTENAGLDSRDGRGIETELESLISRLTDDMSELAMVKLLPRAKRLYEHLHPETKHGGDRDEQVTKSRTCPSFANFVAGRAGISPSSVYSKLKKAADLDALDAEAERLCYGTALANKVGILTRIAAIPKKELHRDIVSVFRTAGPKKAKDELAKWEKSFGIGEEPTEEADGGDEDEPTSEEPANTEPADAGPENAEPEVPSEAALAGILTALGVSTIDECVPAIEALKMQVSSAAPAHDSEQVGQLQTTVQDLRAVLAGAETRCKKLEEELAMFRASPLGELFRLLGTTNAKDALRKARSLMEASDAA